MNWRIVRKSNFNKELFEEKFVENLQGMSQGEAEEVAEALNKILTSDYGEFIFEAVRGDYKLYDGYKELL